MANEDNSGLGACENSSTSAASESVTAVPVPSAESEGISVNWNRVREETGENSSNGAAAETVIDVRSKEVVEEEGKQFNGNSGDLRASQIVPVGTKILDGEKQVEAAEPQKDACVVDIGVPKGCDKLEGERVCRICHLESDQGLDGLDLILLGCNCKGELGVAHRHCAEAWFKLKGDRFCEICGEMALNVTGVGNPRLVEVRNERSAADGGTRVNLSSEWSCWRNQRFCNFLMACLVVAFILPWFFRVNMF